MRSSRWLMTGLGLTLALAGCTESNKLTLSELERNKRDVDKQMRLVREQNEQINAKLNLIKAEMDTIQTKMIPAMFVVLDSVKAKPEQARVQMVAEVDNRLQTFVTDYKQFKEKVTDAVNTNDKTLKDELQTRLATFQTQIDQTQAKVNFVLAQQDSVNREFAVRIDKRPWYKSIIGDWEDRQRQSKSSGTP